MIPSDNNGSERGIRKLKIKLKNSCTFRSDFGADAFLELHSIVETAKKHDKTPYNAIQALFNVSSANSRYVNSILNMNDSLHFVQNLKMCESSFHATMQDKMFVNGNKNL